MTARKEIAVYDGDKIVFTGDAEDVSERFDIHPKNLRMHISRGTRFVREGIRLKPVYTGQLVRGEYEHRGRPVGCRKKEPEPKRKKKQSLSEVVAAARAAGMGYGEYVARMEREKGRK